MFLTTFIYLFNGGGIVKSEVNLKWVLSFHDVGHKDQIHVSRLNGKLLYTLKKRTKKNLKGTNHIRIIFWFF